ncbi:hypothetical protein CCR75_004555 [Bremia lactucae]|uniref:Phosphatidylinositol-glycan biosynthesis class W protein n=1 Tax=Bremia lactucae TaxID=4779 RepID=A0A976IHY5_BRELC|nr:hypothetical protein CCR75_004555 [Bremia lactucae]
MDEDYKLAKEAFVAGLHGTSVLEVFLVFAIAPGCLWLYSEHMLVLEVLGVRQIGSNHLNLVETILIEFIVTVMPTMIGLSYTQYTIPILAVVYTLSAILCALSRYHAKDFVRKHCRKEKRNQLLDKELPFLTNFRAQIMISTCFAILAVDFSVFPRRFAKTETYGFSVMDIGVGAFIVSSAISVKSQTNQGTFEVLVITPRKSYNFLRPIALVLIFGVARFVTVKGVNYQEHVTEYGVHWNFYFTLAGVYLVYSLLRACGKWAVSPIVALLIAFDYILESPRNSLLSQNREGILSLAGYTSLYLVSIYTGQCIFGAIEPNTFKSHRNMRWLLNISYMLWVMAQSLSLIALYSGIQIVCMLPRMPLLCRGVNNNQLFVFIVANLMTGAINLSMHTINSSPEVSCGVLLTYMLLISVVATMLQHINIRIKL